MRFVYFGIMNEWIHEFRLGSYSRYISSVSEKEYLKMTYIELSHVS